MKYGFVKVAAATPQIRVGDTKFNGESIIRLIRDAEKAGVELLVFPELCVCGYTCGDLFGQDVLLSGAQCALKAIADATKGLEMLVFVGVPVRARGVLYNCAAAINGGKVLAFVPKRHLPNYAEFYEKRNFQPYIGENCTVPFNGEEIPFGNKILFRSQTDPDFTVAAELCEDLWVPAPPSVSHALAGANIIVNLSASDETAGKAEYRRLLVRAQSAKTVSAYVYADAGDGESTTDMVFSGHNILCENGEILSESKLFANGLTVSEADVSKLSFERRRINTFYDTGDTCGYQLIGFKAESAKTELTRSIARLPFVPEGEEERGKRAELILSMQSAGLKKRLAHTNAKSAVIGISGGLDSTLALLVCVRTFDKLGWSRKGIVGVTMPGFGTTDRTHTNAVELMNSLGVTVREVSIKEACIQHFKDIDHDINVRDVVYENSQARERTQILMDIANQTSGLVIGTGDLSELALGWATYNGDHMSMYGVNGSVPKTLVKHLVKWVAENGMDETSRATLLDIVDTPISPELIPADESGNIKQITEDLVGPYELHDFFLYYFLRCGFRPSKIYLLATRTFKGVYDDETIKKWLSTFFRRFFNQQFKRSCLPDGPKVGSIAISPRGDWRMPSDASSSAWLKEIEALG